MTSDSESGPRLTYRKRGLLFVLIMMASGGIMAYFGMSFGIYGLLIWGLLIFLSSTLALIPITARLATYGAIAARFQEVELEEKIKERLKKSTAESRRDDTSSGEDIAGGEE
ncbi:MAG: hypothetical protein QXH55_02640 [Candidatus Korarchaeota archaeon]|nr:hypothetical protein [Thermoproteota archaeon]MCR8463028.1 hypothetical protein [Thermoproteota archaeon]MCR8471170.1 hypothetical protein [Thermoproteota archaeon]MCR8471574.1 hypothetical protein [Thermoproteota archaeon]MCR8473073.1 hypothetical protein [Thermoproteota archaeon]